MKTSKKPQESKRGKQDEKLLSHNLPKNPMFQAHNLEGKVKNRGIKNIGNQQKKGKRGDR